MAAENTPGQGGLPAPVQASSEFDYLPYDGSSNKLVLTKEDRYVGPKIKKIYRDKVRRSHPVFDIHDREILVHRALPKTVAAAHLDGDEPIFDAYARTIETVGLENETLSPPFVRTLKNYAFTEAHLADYMGKAVPLFAANIGVTAAYMQWGREEEQHAEALNLILERTGNGTEDELDEDHMDGIEDTWELPFPTGRQMIIYAALQERMTMAAYVALSKHAIKQENAPITGNILKLIGSDEAYHGAGYVRFARVYYDFDPEGTVRDALGVAANFEMPANRIIPDQRRSFVDAVRTSAFAPDMGEALIYQTLTQFGFISKADARRAADAYGERQAGSIDVMNQLKGRLQRRESGILAPGQEITPQ